MKTTRGTLKETMRKAEQPGPTSPAPPTPGASPRHFPARAILAAGLIVVLAVFAWFLLAGRDARPPGPAPEGMVWIPPGSFHMGESREDSFADARPVHEV